MDDSLAVDVGNALGAMVAGLFTDAVWRPDGSAFLPSETFGIAFGKLPPAPAQCIGVTPFSVSDDPGGGSGVLGVQFWIRAPGRDVRPVLNIQDTIREALNGLQQYTLNGHPISVSWLEVTSPQGTDEAGRYQAADTYYFAINRPSSGYFD